MEPVALGSRNADTEKFLRNLAGEYGVHTKTEWHNNNNTLKRTAYVIDLNSISKKLKLGPKHIIESLFKYNQTNKTDLTCIPVAGWSVPKSSWFNCGGQILEAYAKSFSLNPNAAPPENADIILRMSDKAQKKKIIHNKQTDEYFLRVSGNVRITDAEEFLAKNGLAFFPEMPTLHVASLGGAAANGSYGPAKGRGPMTSNIVEMDIVTATGEYKKLSAKENAHLFRAFRDGHLGGCYVRKLTIKVTKDYNMKRHDIQMKDRHEFKDMKENLLDKDHFLFMYIPNYKDALGNHLPRIRVTTFEAAGKNEKRNEPTKNCDDLSTGMKLLLTDLGEDVFQHILDNPELKDFYPLMLNAATVQTYGLEKERTTVGGPSSMHVFKTYSELGLEDDNWMIKVNGTAHARKVLEDLLDILEPELEKMGLAGKYPVFNLFARLQGGIHYPEGRPGINSATIDDPNQKVLSFEMLTFSELAGTPEFKHLQGLIEGYLAKNGLKREFHPGKNRPKNIHSLAEILTDKEGRAGLENFQKALIETHGGLQNLIFSPLFPANKREFAGFDVDKAKTHARQQQEARPSENNLLAMEPVNPHSLEADPKKETKPLAKETHKFVLSQLKTMAAKRNIPPITKLAEQRLGMIAVSA